MRLLKQAHGFSLVPDMRRVARFQVARCRLMAGSEYNQEKFDEDDQGSRDFSWAVCRR